MSSNQFGISWSVPVSRGPFPSSPTPHSTSQSKKRQSSCKILVVPRLHHWQRCPGLKILYFADSSYASSFFLQKHFSLYSPLEHTSVCSVGCCLIHKLLNKANEIFKFTQLNCFLRDLVSGVGLKETSDGSGTTRSIDIVPANPFGFPVSLPVSSSQF